MGASFTRWSLQCWFSVTNPLGINPTTPNPLLESHIEAPVSHPGGFRFVSPGYPASPSHRKNVVGVSKKYLYQPAIKDTSNMASPLSSSMFRKCHGLAPGQQKGDGRQQSLGALRLLLFVDRMPRCFFFSAALSLVKIEVILMLMNEDFIKKNAV